MTRVFVGAAAAFVAATQLACTAPLNWREVRPPGSGLTALFPCRTDHHERRVALAGAAATMQMHVCETAGLTFAVSFVEMDSPQRVARGLLELQALAGSNIGASATPLQALQALQVPGMTPHGSAGMLSLAGRLPGGSPVRLRAAFFTHGLRVFQATVIGVDAGDEAAQPFFSGLKLAA